MWDELAGGLCTYLSTPPLGPLNSIQSECAHVHLWYTYKHVSLHAVRVSGHTQAESTCSCASPGYVQMIYLGVVTAIPLLGIPLYSPLARALFSYFSTDVLNIGHIATPWQPQITR